MHKVKGQIVVLILSLFTLSNLEARTCFQYDFPMDLHLFYTQLILYMLLEFLGHDTGEDIHWRNMEALEIMSVWKGPMLTEAIITTDYWNYHPIDELFVVFGSVEKESFRAFTDCFTTQLKRYAREKGVTVIQLMEEYFGEPVQVRSGPAALHRT